MIPKRKNKRNERQKLILKNLKKEKEEWAWFAKIRLRMTFARDLAKRRRKTRVVKGNFVSGRLATEIVFFVWFRSWLRIEK